MSKAESEKAIRRLVHEWASTQSQQDGWHPSFGDFVRWLQSKGYAHYLEFRAAVPPRVIAEQWFDQELKQTWRN